MIPIPSPRHLLQICRIVFFRLTRGFFASSREAYRLFEASLRLHKYQQASWISDVARQRWPYEIDVISMQATLAFKAGMLSDAFDLLEQCLSASDYRAVDRVLFRTGSRPRDLHQADEVFRFLSRRSDLDFTRRSYALVADAYLMLRLKNSEQAHELIEALEEVAETLRSRNSTRCCQQSNRRNLGKLYVSIGSALYHLACLQGDMNLLFRCWERFAEFSRVIDKNQMNADAFFRMSSNLGRGLALGFLLDPRQHGQARSESLALLKAWTSVNAAGFGSQRPVHGKTPQENHLLFLEALQDSCAELHRSGDSANLQSCRHWARLINHSSERSLTDTIAVMVQRTLTQSLS